MTPPIERIATIIIDGLLIIVACSVVGCAFAALFEAFFGRG